MDLLILRYASRFGAGRVQSAECGVRSAERSAEGRVQSSQLRPFALCTLLSHSARRTLHSPSHSALRTSHSALSSALRAPHSALCTLHLTPRTSSMNITGKTFIITGGASGLGRAAAEAILAGGGNAVLLDVNAETGKAAEGALGAKARFAQADVTSEEQVKAAIDLAVSTFGALNGVVNAAGIGPAAKVVGK